MKTLIVLFGLLFGVLPFVEKINARPSLSNSDPSVFDEERGDESVLMDRLREYSGRGIKTRHSRQAWNGYDRFYERYSNRLILEELYQIRKITEELSDSFKSILQKDAVRPQQPIYIPTLIYTPTEGLCSNLSLTNRFGGNTENSNDISGTIWGIEDNSNTVVDDNDDDGVRPIRLKPVNINQPGGKPAPPVEHGSIQAGLSTTTAPPKTQLPAIGKCSWVIIDCCRDTSVEQQRVCFQNHGCKKTFATGMACTRKIIDKIILQLINLYGPN